jgi:hypothetical protein
MNLPNKNETGPETTEMFMFHGNRALDAMSEMLCPCLAVMVNLREDGYIYFRSNGLEKLTKTEKRALIGAFAAYLENPDEA